MVVAISLGWAARRTPSHVAGIANNEISLECQAPGPVMELMSGREFHHAGVMELTSGREFHHAGLVGGAIGRAGFHCC